MALASIGYRPDDRSIGEERSQGNRGGHPVFRTREEPGITGGPNVKGDFSLAYPEARAHKADGEILEVSHGGGGQSG